jgi:hypothetical protein
MKRFYDEEGIKEEKTMVFSDSLNLELCLKYKAAAGREGFQPTFGVGTFLTSKRTVGYRVDEFANSQRRFRFQVERQEVGAAQHRHQARISIGKGGGQDK